MHKIAFFGSDEIALPLLGHLLEAGGALGEIAAVFSQPDRPSGRGNHIHTNAIVTWAREHGLPVFQPEKPDAATTETLRELGCSVALVMAYGHILKRDLLAVPPLGFFNLHASLLPQLRGAAPIEAAIAERFAETGVSLQHVVPRLDAGAVVDVERLPLAPDETRITLRTKIAAACVPLIGRALPRIFSGDAAGVPQNEEAATYARKITREDAAVDFHAPARVVEARVRALSPWPGVTVPWRDIVLKIGGAAVEDTAADAAPGTILSADKHGVRVATGEGVLRLTHLQRPAGKMLPADAFLAGFPLEAGAVIASQPMVRLLR